MSENLMPNAHDAHITMKAKDVMAMRKIYG